MSQETLTRELEEARQLVTADELLRHIRVLSSDDFAGRLPADVGETKTLEYFEQHFSSLNDRFHANFETHRQTVQAIEIDSECALSMNIRGEHVELTKPHDFVGTSKKQQPSIEFDNSEVVFAGYGIVAPEYNWNDFKDIDIEGKTVIVLCGDPILFDPNNAAHVDQSMFRGNELTYYGRWTYKYEICGARKAAAVLIIHETDRAGYGWDVVTRSFGDSDFDLKSTNPHARASIDGWLSIGAAERLFQKAGLNLYDLKRDAMKRDFRPVALNAAASGKVSAKFKEVESNNMVAVLPGADAKVKDECAIYTAHWDHFGRRPDGVMSGAIDNASGCAGVLATATALASLKSKSPRSIIFMLPTLEEQNLLGSRFFVQHLPQPFSVDKVLAVLNFEMLAPWGKSPSVSSVCKGHTSLDDLLDAAAARQGRTVVGEPQPEKGYVYRSDHLPFMQAGIPALAMFFSAMNHLDRRQSYIGTDYHKVTDKPKADWDLSGAADDTVLLLDVGLQVLHNGYRAKWNPMSEFAQN